MAVLRFAISKTDHEWDSLGKLIMEKRYGKAPGRGTGISRFLYAEIHKLFKGKATDCPGNKAVRTQKNFELTVDDAIGEQIQCEANELGISIGELIAKKIVDRHLTT
jgi:hypothetical protein